ncbi:MAG: metal-dependent hydrolase [Gemmataceae bacterium]|nr:metal-dependent hydrolase [Gemmataceae bacterium]
MASYRGHLMFSTALGAAYGGLAFWYGGVHWPMAIFGAGITSLSGMLPDLDSDSGVPVRTLFGAAGVLVPLFLLSRIVELGLPLVQIAALMVGIYCFIRYVCSAVFKKLTVHRGMFHSLPGMAIAGLLVFLMYHSDNLIERLFLALGTTIGFLSHLVLDELYSVDLSGVKVHLKASAGSAVKLMSPSWPATLATYAVLAGLAFLAYPQLVQSDAAWQKRIAADNWHASAASWVERVTKTRFVK